MLGQANQMQFGMSGISGMSGMGMMPGMMGMSGMGMMPGMMGMGGMSGMDMMGLPGMGMTGMFGMAGNPMTGMVDQSATMAMLAQSQAMTQMVMQMLSQIMQMMSANAQTTMQSFMAQMQQQQQSMAANLNSYMSGANAGGNAGGIAGGGATSGGPVAQGTAGMLQHANQMVGLNENRNTAEINKITKQSGINCATTPWCAAWAMNMLEDHGVLKLDGLSNRNYCPTIKNWAQNKGIWGGRGNYTPKAGDAILFDWQGDGTPDHIGIVERVENGKVYTIEGNSSDSVKKNSYSLSSGSVIGYVKT